MDKKELRNGRVSGLCMYLDSLLEKKRAKRSTIYPIRSAVTKVFKAVEEPEDWHYVDIRAIDMDKYFVRFKNATPGVYSESSYYAYRKRVDQAISLYNRFLEDPDFNYVFRENKKPTKRDPVEESTAKKKKPVVVASEQSENRVPEAHKQAQATRPSVRMADFSLTLASKEVAKLSLPLSITEDDISIIVKFARSLIQTKDNDSSIM
ncbi:hypothetical protein FWH09_02035 [Candidatus Saccharibacteria bacterium]|nr:hypothetical protein [Candidatus Saccharibacteria bacterium]